MKYTLVVLLLILATLTACDQKLTYSEFFEFEAIDYKTVCICNSSGSFFSIGHRYLAGSVRIPETIYGKKVVKIGKKAFIGCDQVKQFIIPSTVKTIDKEAFKGCSSLTSVIFENPNGWKANGNDLILNNPQQNAKYLKEVHYLCTWKQE